ASSLSSISIGARSSSRSHQTPPPAPEIRTPAWSGRSSIVRLHLLLDASRMPPQQRVAELYSRGAVSQARRIRTRARTAAARRAGGAAGGFPPAPLGPGPSCARSRGSCRSSLSRPPLTASMATEGRAAYAARHASLVLFVTPRVAAARPAAATCFGHGRG